MLLALSRHTVRAWNVALAAIIRQWELLRTRRRWASGRDLVRAIELPS
jgi:hypothetical protein